jgi:hypothetical protein
MTVEPVTHERHVIERTSYGIRRRRWERKYRIVLLLADVLAALCAVLAVHGVYGRWAVALALPPVWILSMCAHRAYDRSALGRGTEE